MERIAIVDDDDDILEVMQGALGLHGWDTNVPVRKDSLFADLQAQHPDLIVLDLWLDVPEARWKLLHHLKRKRSTQDIPVIICTGVPEYFDDHELWLRRNEITILSAPCDVSDLDLAIKTRISHNPADGQAKSSMGNVATVQAGLQKTA